MDKTLSLKLKDFQKALLHLDTALKMKADAKDIIRDALIQRFEYTYELCFKTVKLYLALHHGISESTPKPCFRSLRTANILTATDINLLLNMVDDRNKTTHTYSQRIITYISSRIQSYYDIMHKIAHKISEQA